MSRELFKQNSFLDLNTCSEAPRFIKDKQGHIIAYVIAKRWQEDLQVKVNKDYGYIQSLLVHRDFRNRGIGSKLLSHVEAIFKEMGISKVFIGSDLWHYFPGLPAEYPEVAGWFERRGYERAGKV